MKATVVVLNSNFQFARAQTINDLAFSFRIPAGCLLSLSDELEVDLEHLGVVQDVRNVTTGQRLSLKIEPYDVHDLKMPQGWLQPPALARRRGAPPQGAEEANRKEYRAA